ncbi:dTDP-glucose 4,6-dehydratase [Schinkia azotoformans]|uniref:dTDP-glucose 4,6-dehydratase n=1 Tax=Schinkia azotoformans TaxID=1454 RepID=UPI002DBC66CF|nr:dTDP-glucose 4,6-dehydratase [Schinkia azotoformans]MEC1769906.1 dTDP-glucose 4,6-dehydratase [Schinkia azotoformans]MED4367186.1 dTDP-glucose 4,6-dehydratase [Schinkia azotoformans]
MRLLVTGGAGFIGSNFIRYFLKKHPNSYIVNFDKLTYAGNLDNLANLQYSKYYTFVRGDITNKELVNYIVMTQKIDTIVNFAAESHVDRSITNSEEFVKTNIVGTQILLDIAKYYSLRFIQISTDEVYGSLGENGYFTEDTPLSPNSPYSASKASADLLVRSYHKTYGLNVNITRCSNNYGPFQFPEKLIPLMIINTIQGKKLPIYGNGKNIRDWLHVEDHCSAIDLVIHKGIAGEIYNIGGHNEQTNLEIVETIVNTLGGSHSLITYVPDRLGHDYRYALDSSKIQNELGWNPFFSIKEGLEETILWYKKNQGWWEKLITG